MAGLSFRDLRADEIDVRIAMVKDKGISLLLYKDARCDMNILDETVGTFNWQRSHSRDNANCTVSIWDSEKAQWISKEDVGTESNTEAVKGLASDSFKRACFNWGIGRELYTAPFIWVKAENCNLDKGKCYDKFSVAEITISEKKIIALSIKNDTTGNIVYTFGKASKPAAAAQPKATPKATAKAAPVQTAATVDPNTGEPESDLPFEITTESNRDKFRAYIKKHKFTDNQVIQVLNACGISDGSSDDEWEKGLLYAIALNGGVQA